MGYKELWEDFYKDGKYIMWEPSESTIKFFGRVSKDMDIRGLNALDFGCGVGRNSFFMMRIGLAVYGIDISENAIEHAKYKRFDTKNLFPHFKIYNGSTIPYKDNEFDFVVSHGVLDHVLFNKAKELIKEIHRVSKPNGLVELEIHSVFDSRYGKGKKIDKNIFIIEDECEKDLPQHYFDKEELSELIKGFKLKRLLLDQEIDYNNNNYTTSFWILYLEVVK